MIAYASHARWSAKAKGGTIKVYDQDGELFKSIEIPPDLEIDKGFVLPLERSKLVVSSILDG